MYRVLLDRLEHQSNAGLALQTELKGSIFRPNVVTFLDEVWLSAAGLP